MATIIDVSTLGSAGFVLEGEVASDKAGWSVSSAGDVNGDGLEDFIIGAPDGGPDALNGYSAGAVYVIYGKTSAFDARIDLGALSAADGFIIHGDDLQDKTGISVSSAGDLNGDGIDDLLVGASQYSPTTNGNGRAYVVFGKSGERATLELGGAHTAADFILIGGDQAGDKLGFTVSSAGDFNGDGFDDIVLGARDADAAAQNAGKAYVIFGHEGGFADIPDLGALPAGAGMVLQGDKVLDAAGYSVSSAGDVNGDGIDDLLVGALLTDFGDPATAFSLGTVYVVFGKADPADVVNLADLTAADGFAIRGGAYEQIGSAVSEAGDVNGDGFDDLIVGSIFVDDGGSYAGAAYVLFGKASGFGTVPPGGGTPEIDVNAPIAATDGFAIIGDAAQDALGSSISAAGDVNGDGFDDIIIGAIGAEPSGAYATGEAYVIFGKASGFGTIDPGNLLPEDGFIIQGDADSDRLGRSVSAADVNGDGFSDIIVGASQADIYDAATMGEFVDAGETYVIFGIVPTTAVNRTGSAAGQTISGGGFDDTLSGLGGDDELFGNGGNDILNGGTGVDVMRGGAGNDTYEFDNAGDQAIEAAAGGTDTVRSSITLTLGSQLENLTLLGSANINGTGNSLVNTIFGNSGNNTLNGLAGADTMRGLGGNDTYIVDNIGDKTLELVGDGTDTVQSSVALTLLANVENLTLTGSANINGAGNTLNNALTGNSGANLLNGLGGADTMSGGAGNDTYIVDNAGDVVTEAAAAGTDKVQSSVTFTLGTNVETLILTGASAINGTGNTLANSLNGNGAANTLNGAAGADTMRGGGGNDIYIVDNAADIALETSVSGGTDTVQSSIAFTLIAFLENLTLTGIANINGTGNTLANILTGNDGNNSLNGAAGADTMNGGLGNDTYIVDNVGDQAVEGSAAGVDLVQSSVTFTIGNNVENLTLTGTGNVNGTGNGLVNVINGNSGNNVLDGKAGGDTMRGGNGDDNYIVDNVGDVVTESSATGGDDRVQTLISFTLGNNVEDLKIIGAAAVDGTGNALANSLVGNAAANQLNGLAGSDTLEGGAGADGFRFTTALGATNVDRILDFTVVDDTIFIDNAVFTGLAAGALAAGAFRNGSAAVDADDRIIYNAATGALLFDVDGVGGTAAVQFATLDGAPVLTSADFQVI